MADLQEDELVRFTFRRLQEAYNKLLTLKSQYANHGKNTDFANKLKELDLKFKEMLNLGFNKLPKDHSKMPLLVTKLLWLIAAKACLEGRISDAREIVKEQLANSSSTPEYARAYCDALAERVLFEACEKLAT